MRPYLSLGIFFLLIYSVCPVGAQILIDESNQRGSWLGSSVKADLQSFTSVEAMRDRKKMAISTTVSGATGLLGLNLNLNFSKEFTTSFGVGLSRGFQSFNAHIKYSLGGTSIMPYLVGGYSRWYTNDPEGEIKRTSPPVLAKKFLSGKERATGDFDESLIYPGIGLEYVNLSGDWQGLGLFAELLMLIDIDDFVTGPTIGVGSIYYF